MAPLRKAAGSLTKMYGPFKKGGCGMGRGVSPLREDVGPPHRKCIAPLREEGVT